ncbi:hypothetical protein MCEHALHM7_00879 [Methylophilaceae bacterium]
MYIKKNIVDRSFIKKINAYLDNVKYESSLWIFPGEHPTLYKLIKNNLSITPFFKSILKSKDCYIVIRMVNKNDSKRSLEAHFDNYTRTFFIPLKIPKDTTNSKKEDLQGNLYLWEKARSMPQNLIVHIITKLTLQNKYVSKIIMYVFTQKFKKINMEIGDLLYFNGFTTFHYNALVSAEHRSLVIHTDMPFSQNTIMRWIDLYSRYRVKK